MCAMYVCGRCVVTMGDPEVQYQHPVRSAEFHSYASSSETSAHHPYAKIPFRKLTLHLAKIRS